MKGDNLRTADSKYWNPYIETMPREELDKFHLKNIKDYLKYAYDNSPMYKKLYDKAGIKPEDIRTLDDFIKYAPIVDKKDLVQAQAVKPPYGDAWANKDDTIMQHYMTTGSTGVPLQIPYLYYDQIRSADAFTYAWWAIGLRPKDVFYFAFNFGAFSGFWPAYWAVIALGGKVIPGGGLDTKARVNQVMAARPTVLLSTPTYALYMAEVAREMGVDLSKSAIKVTYHGGEPGANIPSTRNAIEKAWGAKTYDFYGLAETLGIGCGCLGQGGLHIIEAQQHPIVIDEKGNVVPDGGVGELIVTSFCQLSQPVIKYRTHDLVEWYHEKCPDCGRTWIFLKNGILGRTDNMVIIKGVNIYPAAVEAIVGTVGGLSENYELHVSREHENDTMVVKIEALKDLPDSRYEDVKIEAEERLYQNMRVRIGVEVLKPSTLPRYELKAKRFFDHRPEDKRWQIQR